MNTVTVIGLLFVGGGMGLGMVVGARLTRIGGRRPFAGLAWFEYLRVCNKHGWSRGLVYWMFAALVVGITLLVFGAKYSGAR